jgi:hypothetical protein
VSDKGRLSKPWTLSGAQKEYLQPWTVTPVSPARTARARRALAPAARTGRPVQTVPLDQDDLADLYGDFA